MKYIVLFFSFLFMIACSSGPEVQKIDNTKENRKKNDIQESTNANQIYDLQRFEQNSWAYLKDIEIKELSVKQEDFESSYFSPWNRIPTDSKETAMWPFYSYKHGDMYGENLKLIEEQVFEDIKDNADFDSYKTLNQRAITLKHINIRAFPTSKPMFKDPNIAGEGFPFDYMQNSTISANKPLLISHYSKDKQWAYVFTSFTGGWVEAKDIIDIDKKYTDLWQRAKQIFLIKDNIPLYDKNGNFLFNSRVGMMLSLIEEDKDNYTVLTVSSYKNHQPNYHKTKISKNISHKEIMDFNKENIQKIFDEVAKSKYGWGGLYGERDCSSTIRDIYTPFGVWFPRNSYQQSRVGKTISMENLSDQEKIELIKKDAIPFKTLLYKKGHILIYVGVDKDEVIAFHNTWGIKTKDNDDKEGRVIVGKSVYSSLRLGSNQKDYDKDSEILKNLLSMNIVVN
ncbi:SH3 domain-containing protein [Sulfurimonas sp.]|uniref:SH3 domain-containing protein n=1 Tax=Sulfurimonas sp. TaxID=2022749 RepID=UPI00356929D4